jgi:hypothetical protein
MMKLKVRIDCLRGERRCPPRRWQVDNQPLFPDVCVKSPKWFRGGREMFRRRATDETFRQKYKQFQLDELIERNALAGRSKVSSRPDDLGV